MVSDAGPVAVGPSGLGVGVLQLVVVRLVLRVRAVMVALARGVLVMGCRRLQLHLRRVASMVAVGGRAETAGAAACRAGAASATRQRLMPDAVVVAFGCAQTAPRGVVVGGGAIARRDAVLAVATCLVNAGRNACVGGRADAAAPFQPQPQAAVSAMVTRR